MNTMNNEPLPKTMPAVVCRGPQDYRLEEWRVPEAGHGEVIVKVDSVGICASDLKCYLGAALFWGDDHRVGYAQPPVIPGHEFVGTVVALGAGAGEKYGLALGDTCKASPGLASPRLASPASPGLALPRLASHRQNS